MTEPLLLDIHRTLGYLLGFHAHRLTNLSQSYNYECFQNWLPLLRAGIDDTSDNYVSKIMVFLKHLISFFFN